MDIQTLTGQTVTLDSAVGNIRRIVVKDLGDIVLVTRTEEFERAQVAGVEPLTIGFKKSDIVRIERT